MNTNFEQPLLYDCRELVAGNDFAALVSCAGAALVEVEEDGSVTILSVEPGGFAGCGESFHAAYADLIRNLREILWDLAYMADSHEDFHSLARTHLAPARPELLAEWSAAAKRIGRARKSDLALPRTKKYSARGLRISRVKIEDPDDAMEGPLAEPVIATKAA